MNDNFQNDSDNNNNQYTNQTNQNQQYDPNQQQQQQYDPNQQQNQQYNNQQYNPNQQQQYNPNQQQQYNPNTQYNINVNVPPPGYVPKSKIAAGLLGIFLGSIGVHNFYLGYTGKAVAQLLITVLSCGIGAAVTSIWGLIEGILILTGSINIDGKGVPLSD